MSILDTLFGGTRRPRSLDEPLIALSTAAVTLEAELGLVPAGQAGLVIRPVDSEEYRRAEADLTGLLEIAGRETGATITERTDAYGYRWVVITSDAIADLVSTAYSVSIQLRDAGFGDQVLAAAFGFRDAGGRPAYWLYNFKRAGFYPFVPQPDGTTRDTAHELQLAAALEREVPVEPDQARWYPMWGMPLDGAPPARPAGAAPNVPPNPDGAARADAHNAASNDRRAGHGHGSGNNADDRHRC